VERVAGEVHGGQFGVGDLDLGVRVLIEAGVDLEPGAGGGRGDQVDDHLVGDQRLAGWPRQLREMKLNRRCSTLFHLLVPGGK
jgi:hypothetical protein